MRTSERSLGVYVILLTVLFYFVPQLMSGRWNCDWCYPGVPLLEVPYADLRLISSAIKCEEQGRNTQIENPCDFASRTFNYPRFWLNLKSLGLSEENNSLFGVGVSILYFICVLLIFQRTTFVEGILVSSMLISPSLMLGVERGNTDLVVFLILTLAIIGWRQNYRRFLPYVLFGFAATLKLYPVLTFATSLREGYRRMWLPLLLILSLFSLNIVLLQEQLPAINRGSTQFEFYSYGLRVCQMHLEHFKMPLIFSSQVFLFGILSLFTLCGSQLLPKQLRLDPFGWRLDAFRLGSSIYCGTFLVRANWDYRLIFLLFTVPQLLMWAKHVHETRLFSRGTLVVLIFFLWASPYSSPGTYYLDEVSSMLLFASLSALFLRSLPSRLHAPER